MFEIGQLTRLPLGYVGENGTRTISIDMKAWLDEYPGALIMIQVIRPVDRFKYPASYTKKDGVISWTVSAEEVIYAGKGLAQIALYDPETKQEYKSRVVGTIVAESLEGFNEIELEDTDPANKWVNKVLTAAEEAFDSRDEAAKYAASAKDSVREGLVGIINENNADKRISSDLPYAVRELGMGQPETWSSSYRHILVPVGEGDEIVIRANGSASTFYAFLASDEAGSTVNIPYVEGTARQSVGYGSWATVVAPAGTKYLCLNYDTVSGSYYYLPDALYINGVDAFQPVRRTAYIASLHRVECEPGTYNRYSPSSDPRAGYHTVAYDNLATAIKTPRFIRCTAGECVQVLTDFALDGADTSTDVTVRVWEYKADKTTIKQTAYTVSANTPAYHKLGNNAAYIRIAAEAPGLVNVLADPHIMVGMTATTELKQSKAGNGPLYSEANQFCYTVKDGIYTSGRLILPPNYSSDGKPVPLLVWCHGSSGYRTITDGFSESYLPIMRYIRDEGYAIFDCYPWTTKFGKSVTTDESYRSPFALDICMDAYIAGAEYVCSHWNIDRNRIVVGSKSLGGQMATKLAYQTRLPVRAVAGLCPGLDVLAWHSLGYNKAVRALMVQELGLTGNVDAFLDGNGWFENSSAAGRAFLSENLGKIAAINPAWYGLVGITAQEKLEQSLAGSAYAYVSGTFTFNGEGEVSGYYTHDGMLRDKVNGEYVNGSGDAAEAARLGFVRALPNAADTPYNKVHLAKICSVPIKIWAAEDDTQVPYYKAYEMVVQLQNGGCTAELRTMPNGVGGHGSVDTSTSALRTNVVTALGISHSSIPVAVVEMIDYFGRYV